MVLFNWILSHKFCLIRHGTHELSSLASNIHDRANCHLRFRFRLIDSAYPIFFCHDETCPCRAGSRAGTCVRMNETRPRHCQFRQLGRVISALLFSAV